MRYFSRAVIIIFLVVVVSADHVTDNPRMVRFFKTILSAITGKTMTSRGLAAARKAGRLQTPLPEDSQFLCDVRQGQSGVKPTSVHQLRPGDIDVIASLGDSLSAGNGLAATHLTDIAVDNRGLSWVIGGSGNWKQFLTLPNILKEFNPNLVGYAEEDATSYMKQAKFSVSEPGAMSRDMPYAAQTLIKRMKHDARVDFNNDWKLINFFIGGNDFCTDVCYLTDAGIEKSHEGHRRDLIQVFDFLFENSPRTFVNVILAPKTEIGTEIVGKPFSCAVTHRFECPCMFGLAHKQRQKQMQRIQDRWIQIEQEVASDAKYRAKPDFALVVQPFVPKSRIPKLPSGKTDLSFISTDCFHFSQKGSARAANALWNNMLEPVGNKSLIWEPLFERFLCPSKRHPYFYTWANSNNF